MQLVLPNVINRGGIISAPRQERGFPLVAGASKLCVIPQTYSWFAHCAAFSFGSSLVFLTIFSWFVNPDAKIPLCWITFILWIVKSASLGMGQERAKPSLRISTKSTKKQAHTNMGSITAGRGANFSFVIKQGSLMA